MRNFKKVIAAGLALLMLALSVNVSFAAEEYSAKEAVVVAKVNAAGIMTGTDKGFEPSKSLTRAEAAAIIVRMKGISESAVKAMSGTTLFTDVAASHWASGYVNQASNLGIVKGVSATQFAPDREVTIAEFVTMAVRALGAGQLVDSEGTWPTNYVNFANENDILKDVTAIYTAVATRMNAATIVANTLESSIWEKSGVKSNGEISWTKSTEYITTGGTVVPAKTILGSVLNIAVYKDTDVSVDKVNRKVSLDDYNELGSLKAADKVDLGSLKAGVSYDVWYDNDDKEIVGIWEAEDSKQELTDFTEVVEVKESTVKFKVDGADKKYDLATTFTVYYNGKSDNGASTPVDYTLDNSFVNKENTFGSFKLVDNKVKYIYLEEYTNVGKVDEIVNGKIKFDVLDGYGIAAAKTLTIDDDDIVYNMDMSTIKEGDVVFYYKEGKDNVYHVAVDTETVEGKVTAQGEDYIKVAGEKYKLVGSLAIANGKDIIAYLNEAGKIVAYELKEDAKSDYAVIQSLEAVNGRKGVDIELVLAYSDGTLSDTMTLDLEETADEEVIEDCDEENEVLAYVAYEAIANAGTPAKITVDAINTAVANDTSILGNIVAYEIKDGKVVLKAIKSDDYKEDTNKKLTISRKSGIDGLLFSNSAKVLLVKADSKKDYKVKVELVELDSLETSTGVDYAAADIDDGYASFVVLYNDNKNVTRVTEDGLYGVILNKETLDEDEDFKFAYTVLFTDGKSDTYYSDEDYAEYGEDDYNLIGTTPIEFTLADNEITDVDYDTTGSTDTFKVVDLTAGGTKTAYAIDTNNDGIFEFAELVSGTTKEEDITKQGERLAENVIFVKRSGSTAPYKYSAGKETDLEVISYNKNSDDVYTIDGEKQVYTLFERLDEDGTAEIIAIVFAK